jgi:hypothetical protein
MPYNSLQLLYHFASYRNELRRLVLASQNLQDNLPVRYSVDPAYKRSLILMSAKHDYGLNGRCIWSREQTFLHHKAAVVQLLRQQIMTSPDNPGEWSFSVILFLVAMESLDQDKEAAETHLRGLLTIMRTRLPGDGSLYASSRAFLRLALLYVNCNKQIALWSDYIHRFLSLVQASKMTTQSTNFTPMRWRANPNDPFILTHYYDWANVAYLLCHFVSEFLIRGNRLTTSTPADPIDIACLQWLLKSTRSVRNGRSPSLSMGIVGSSSGILQYQDAQKKVWVLAGTCYALLLAGISDPTPEPSPETERSGGSIELALNGVEMEETLPGIEQDNVHQVNELRVWWENIIEDWTEAQTLPDTEVSLGMLDKIAWLTSTDGERVIEQMCADITAQVGSEHVRFGV